MIELYWNKPQLESLGPQILEEFDGYEIINLLEDSREYPSVYQVFQEVERLLTLVKNREHAVAYLKAKLR